MATILIVDDEPMVCDLLVGLVRMRGDHTVDSATGPRDAIDIARQRPPNLLITDWMLADEMDGVQLANALRKANPSLPVIVVTGFLSDELEKHVDALPRTWVLAKPCGFEELTQTIKTALESNADGADAGAASPAT